MEQKLIIEKWLKRKLSFNSHWLLKDSLILEHEFKGARFGHPSTYAFVRFEITPSEELAFESAVDWTQYAFLQGSEELHETLICEAIVDGLVCDSTTPFSGCSLKLTSIKYDEYSSSPVAFYKATKEVLKELIKTGRWDLISEKH
jgi:hypothetical protein